MEPTEEINVSYSCHLVAQKALHPEVTRRGLRSAALCDSARVCRTKTSLQRVTDTKQHLLPLIINSSSTPTSAKKKIKSYCIDTVCTLPSAVPQLPETAPLTQPVEPLLLDKLQDLRLNPLPQLTGQQIQHEQQKEKHACYTIIYLYYTLT